MLADSSQSNPRGSGAGRVNAVALSSRGRLIKAKRRQEEVEEFPSLALASHTHCDNDALYGLAHGDYASDTDVAPPIKARRAQSMSVVHESSEARPASTFMPLSRRAAYVEKAFPSDSSLNKAGGIFKTAAVQVLRRTGRLMCTGDITKAAVTMGFINVQGKTPDATMASALYTDIKRKEGRSVFIKPHEGLFGLREWLDKGHCFEDPHERVEADAGASSPLREEPRAVLSQAQCRHNPGTERSPTSNRRPVRGGGASMRRRIEAVRSFSAPLKLSPGRRFAGNMDVLFAAVDVVARDELTPASSDSAEAALRVSSAIHSPSAMPEGQSLLDAGKPFVPPFLGESRTELRSCSSSEAAASPSEVAAATAGSHSDDADPHGQDALARLTAAARAELVVQTLEASPGVDPALLMQAYMQLCKLCGEAGLLEKACSSLARAMEIGEWTRPS